jgi:hypothetical protein
VFIPPQKHSSSGSLVITMIPKAKYRLNAAAILFYFIQKIAFIKAAEILKTCYRVLFQDPKLSANSISQVYVPSTLLVLITGN